MPKELKLVAIIAAVSFVMLWLYDNGKILGGGTGGGTNAAASSNSGY